MEDKIIDTHLQSIAYIIKWLETKVYFEFRRIVEMKYWFQGL